VLIWFSLKAGRVTPAPYSWRGYTDGTQKRQAERFYAVISMTCAVGIMIPHVKSLILLNIARNRKHALLTGSFPRKREPVLLPAAPSQTELPAFAGLTRVVLAGA
jgi:hypothetical protein